MSIFGFQFFVGLILSELASNPLSTLKLDHLFQGDLLHAADQITSNMGEFLRELDQGTQLMFSPIFYFLS